MRALSRWLAPLALALALAAAADAQTVRGRIVDHAGQPILTALVTLRDDAGATVRTALSRGDGEFSIAAGRTGGFTLRVERIGFAQYDSERFVLEHEAAVVTLNLAVTASPVLLAAVRAEGSSRCPAQSLQERGAMAQLWDEAGKALRITALAEALGRPVTSVRYRRELDSSARIQRRVESHEEITSTGTSFAELRTDALERFGFAIPLGGDTVVYFAPSANNLLSDAFIARHCFHRIVADRADATRVGLAFQPVPDAQVVGITGTVWLDRASAELRSVEYTYVEPRRTLPGTVSGLVEFDMLPNGVPHVAGSGSGCRSSCVHPPTRRSGSARCSRRAASCCATTAHRCATPTACWHCSGGNDAAGADRDRE